MRKSLKIAAVATALFLVLGAATFVYAAMLNGSGNDEQQTNMQNIQGFLNSNNITLPNGMNWPCRMNRRGQMFGNGLPLGSFLSENTTLSTVEGSVVSQLRGILILDTGSGQVRVLIPNAWTLGNDVVSRAELFNGTFASTGQTLTVNVLESTLFSNTNFSVNMMLGYEATNATGTHAYAVLPFNIQPTG